MTDIAIYPYLSKMIKEEASDLYLTVGVPPTMRVSDRLHALSDVALGGDDIQDMLGEILTSRQRREFESRMELNLALDMGKDGRFRINVLRQRQYPALVIRRITGKIPTFEELRLPKMMEALSLEKRGLVLMCGMTGSGKSTSLAAMADFRNRMVSGHIITIEDPIEFFYEHKKGIVTQREVGIDTDSYHIALKNALRQKPDMILVGEIRDREVMEQALVAAETGHLCLSTVHANNASQAVERIINFFPEDRHQQVRIALSMNLRAIISQRLVSSVRGHLVVALEILLNEGLIKEHILKGDTVKIREVMAQNNAAGMVVFDQALLNLYKAGIISEQTVIAEADFPTDMKMKIWQINLSGRGNATSDIDSSGLSL